MEEEDGTTEGPCPFIVHGLTGEEFFNKNHEDCQSNSTPTFDK